MVRFAMVLSLLAGCALPGKARAAEDACKACRDDLHACMQAHSKDACRTNYDICLRHCRPQASKKQIKEIQ
jgi:hypothetical protein